MDRVKTNKHIFTMFSHHSSYSLPNDIAIFRRKPPNRGVGCRWGRQRSRLCGLTACVNAATGQALDHGHRLASCDTSLVVSGGVDCGRRRRNVYNKKPQRYAKDNRTAHLTALSDKSVAYVANNKRLYSTFCTVEATTDRHEASRGLFATAELLVVFPYQTSWQ